MGQLEDSLKYFSDVDNYSTTITKEDMDTNLKKICQGIGFLQDETDATMIVPQNSGVTKIKSPNATSVESNSISWGEESIAGENSLSVGYKCEASGNLTSVAIGSESSATGIASYVFGLKVHATALGSVVLCGYDITNKQDMSFSIGASTQSEGNAKQTIRHYQYSITSDDAQKSFNKPIKLFIKSLNHITMRGQAYQDDYATKWVFERKIIVSVNDAGEITVVSDDATDIVKDDADWAFDIDSANDSDTPTLIPKVTGKADTNIIWDYSTTHEVIYWL